jgi:hypothetical protein
MTATLDLKVNWKNVPTQRIIAGGLEFAYRELGTNNPGTPVVFLVHLAAVLDNWDPRVVDVRSREVHTTADAGVTRTCTNRACIGGHAHGASRLLAGKRIRCTNLALWMIAETACTVLHAPSRQHAPRAALLHSPAPISGGDPCVG